MKYSDTINTVNKQRGILTESNIMEFWALKACNFKCGYCGLVETGEINDNSHILFYKDKQNREKIARFFTNNKPCGRNWAVMLTGGEPFLLPEIDDLVNRIAFGGNTICFYTNNSIPVSKILSNSALRHVQYIQASFHPDWHMAAREKTTFFDNVELIKAQGVPVLVRFVGSVFLLPLLPELSRICEEIGVCFYVTACFDEKYPENYTPEERAELASYMGGYSSLLQLDGGVDMRGRICQAGSRLFATRFHDNFNVSPCITIGTPIIGNILDDWLSPYSGGVSCLNNNILCTCDIHFQQGIVSGVDDSHNYEQQLNGFTTSVVDTYDTWKNNHNIKTKTGIHVQGANVHTKAGLVKKMNRTIASFFGR